MTTSKEYVFNSKIYSSEVGQGGAYVVFPFDVRKEFHKGRAKVKVSFDGISYEGSVVNMGVKNKDGSICYIIGIKKEIRLALEKTIGDTVSVRVIERGE